MPAVGDHIAAHKMENPESEKLCLSSSFSPTEIVQLGLVLLAHKEGQLPAFDALWSLQTAVKVIDALQDREKKDAYGHTQALTQIQKAEFHCDLIMADYSAAHKAMITLGVDSGSFPELQLQDTF